MKTFLNILAAAAIASAASLFGTPDGPRCSYGGAPTDIRPRDGRCPDAVAMVLVQYAKAEVMRQENHADILLQPLILCGLFVSFNPIKIKFMKLPFFA